MSERVANTSDRPPASGEPSDYMGGVADMLPVARLDHRVSGEPSTEALRNALEEVLDVWPAPSPEAFHRLHRLLTGHDSCDEAEARATPLALDVERLARALAGYEGVAAFSAVELPIPEHDFVPIDGLHDFREVARLIAAEYAMLTSKEERP